METEAPYSVWRMTSGVAPDAVKAARPVLNGEDEETGQKGTAPCPYPTSPHGEGVSVCVWTAEGRCLLEAARATGALWHHEVLHRRMGGLRAAYRCRAASRGEGEHTENREQAHQSTDPHQAVSASYAVLF